MTKNNKKMTPNNSRRPKKTKKSKVLWTDRQTDRPTDGAGCRVACTRLKTGGDKRKKEKRKQPKISSESFIPQSITEGAFLGSFFFFSLFSSFFSWHLLSLFFSAFLLDSCSFFSQSPFSISFVVPSFYGVHFFTCVFSCVFVIVRV